MQRLTRRDLLKSSLATPAVVLRRQTDDRWRRRRLRPRPPARPRAPAPGRERLLLDFGWRFHFGHATDAAQDFNFRGNFSKTGNFGPVGTLLFDDSDWKAVDLPHDWAIELPFQNDPALSSKGFYPLGRQLPGHQRRLVPPHLRTSGLRRGQAHHPGIRRRLPRSHGHLQRLLHRPAHRRLRPVQLRRDRFRHPRRPQRAAGARGRHPERRLVLRRRGHLPARLAGEDQPGAREEVGHVRAHRSAARRSHGPDPHGGGEPRQGRAERARHLDHSRSRGQGGGEGGHPAGVHSPSGASTPTSSRWW